MGASDPVHKMEAELHVSRRFEHVYINVALHRTITYVAISPALVRRTGRPHRTGPGPSLCLEELRSSGWPQTPRESARSQTPHSCQTARGLAGHSSCRSSPAGWRGGGRKGGREAITSEYA